MSSVKSIFKKRIHLAAVYQDKNMKTTWIKYALMILIFEKIIQHVFVSAAFFFNWKDIRSTVVVNPSVLMLLGTVVALLFMLSLWGMLTQKNWMINLLIALALFDMIGEFVAQGTIAIVITMSFIIASLLLILSLSYRQKLKLAT